MSTYRPLKGYLQCFDVTSDTGDVTSAAVNELYQGVMNGKSPFRGRVRKEKQDQALKSYLQVDYRRRRVSTLSGIYNRCGTQ